MVGGAQVFRRYSRVFVRSHITNGILCGVMEYIEYVMVFANTLERCNGSAADIDSIYSVDACSGNPSVSCSLKMSMDADGYALSTIGKYKGGFVLSRHCSHRSEHIVSHRSVS